MSDLPPSSGGSGAPWNEGRPPRRSTPRPRNGSVDPTADATGSRRVLGSSTTPSRSTAVVDKGKPAMRHARPPKRGRVALRVGLGIVVVLALVVVGVVGYGWWRYSQIHRDSLDLASSSGGVQNFLIVGSDSRSGISKSDSDASAFLNAPGAKDSGQRSDTIMVARVDSKNKTIDLMSFPRDLWVPIMPSGEPERINTAFAQGKDSADGAQRLIDTIRADFGIDINHYVEINFGSFKGITEAVGGVPMYFDKQVRDRNSGLYVLQTGCVTLDGEGAIAYARSRHLEYLDPKTKKWIEDPSADLGRISRQTYFMRTMLDRAQGKFGSMDVKAVNGLVSSIADNLTLDKGLSIGDLVSLGKSFKGFSGSQIQTHALPVYLDMTSGGASILRLDTAAAEDVFNVFRHLPAGTVTPRSVVVGVTNASGTKGAASEVSARLAQLRYQATAVGDVAKSQTATTIRYLPGYEKQADLLSRQLGGGATVQVDKTLKASQPVSLTLGTAFTGVLAEPLPTSTTSSTAPTSSTAAGATTTTGPVTTIKPGEITDYVGVVAGEPPEGTSCR